LTAKTIHCCSVPHSIY